MKVLCFYYEIAHEIYKKGIYPSHFLYGAIEIEKDGHDVVVAMGSNSNKFGKFFSHARTILKHKPDVLFLPFISKDVVLIILLKKIGLFNKPVIGWSHKGVKKKKNGIISWVYKQYYKSFDKIFFLSEVTMEQSVSCGIIDPQKAIFIEWGCDLHFFDKIKQLNIGEDYFITTGKENRDFGTLIESFQIQKNANLRLYTNISHDGRKYDYLERLKDLNANIEIHVIENDNNSLLFLAKETASSFCVTVPLVRSSITYCLGLSSIVEAMALSKPIIVSRNPYHSIDVSKEGIGIVVDGDIQSWNNAIEFMVNHPEEAEEMGKRGRALAEKKYNMQLCSQVILKNLDEVIAAYY